MHMNDSEQIVSDIVRELEKAWNAAGVSSRSTIHWSRRSRVSSRD